VKEGKGKTEWTGEGRGEGVFEYPYFTVRCLPMLCFRLFASSLLIVSSLSLLVFVLQDLYIATRK
jgi:hypothetical protein